MGKFIIYYTNKAKKDFAKHKKSGNKPTATKIKKILNELKIHPESGTGKPEQLKADLKGYWSRRINHKDRLIYRIEKEKVTVLIVSAMGHYDDK